MNSNAPVSETFATADAVSKLSPLKRVRDTGDYSSRNTSKGALVKEAFILFSAARERGLTTDQLRDTALRGQMFPGASYENRQRIWDCLHWRYFAAGTNWIQRALASATAGSANAPLFLSVAYLYFSLRDRLTFDLVTDLVWSRWRSQSVVITVADVLEFLERASNAHPAVKKWRASTRTKLAQSILAGLRDFGVLRGIQRKQIQRPVISPEAVFHLLCVLLAEGLSGRAVLDAPDWHLFLWTEDDVAKALSDLSQRRWIRFEGAGRTVILELIRIPEV